MRIRRTDVQQREASGVRKLSLQTRWGGPIRIWLPGRNFEGSVQFRRLPDEPQSVTLE
jgi:hypothetical protein